MKAVAYCRVSTEGQATDGVSLAAQGARIQAWCTANDYELIGTHVDAGLSGCRSDNRPGLQAALAEACRSKGALIVYSLSRLARSTKDAIAISERLAKSGADLVSLTEKIDTTSAAGKMIFRLLAVLAEFERDQVAERTRAALGHLRRQSLRVSGRLPYGFDLAGDRRSLIPNVQEQAGLQLIHNLRRTGLGRRRIAAQLNASGTLTKTGVPWSPQAVGNILRREHSMSYAS